MKQTSTKLSKALSALPFAHLLGMSAARAEDDEVKQGADESDEDFAKRMEEKDEQEKENDAKKAEEDKKEAGDDEDGDEDEDDADDEKKGKKAKKAKEGDDEKEKAARASERARCAAIFKCGAAGARPDVAAHLAFETDMSSANAIAMLGAVAAGAPARPGNLASRMAAVQAPNVGASAGAAPAANSAQGVAARIIAAGKKRRGEA